MQYLPDINAYCQHIGVTSPTFEHIDVRSFADNMRMVRAKMPPFRHGCYAIAWRTHGGNREVMGDQLNSSVFFNAPYEIVTWDIDLDWEGYYVIFDDEFARDYMRILALPNTYPFFLADQSKPIDLEPEDIAWFAMTFERLYAESRAGHPDARQLMGGYLQGMLRLLGRRWKTVHPDTNSSDSQQRDSLLINRFRAMALEKVAEPGRFEVRKLSAYASALAVHPNHLNAIAKKVTASTASGLLNDILLSEAKRLLRRTDLQIQEISDRLQFSAATHFNAFFRRLEGVSAGKWRKILTSTPRRPGVHRERSPKVK